MGGAIVVFTFQFFYKACAAAALLLRAPQAGFRPGHALGLPLRLAALAFLALSGATALLYLVTPNFADYGEVAVAVLGGNLRVGAPVYRGLDVSQGLVGSNYGPLVFAIQAGSQALVAGFPGSKMPGLVAAALALGATFAAVGRVGRDRDEPWLAVIAMVALSAGSYHFWYWNRPDPALMACVAMAALAHSRLPAPKAAGIIAVLAGLALNLKAFAPVYLVPLWLDACGQPHRRLAPVLALSAVAFLVTAALPFLAFDISMADYASTLSRLPAQGLEFLPYEGLGFGLLLAVLLAKAGSLAPGSPSRILGWATLAMTALVVLLSGKPGGGSPYGLPLLPLVLYAAALGRRHLAPEEAKARLRLFARHVIAFLALVLPFSLLVALHAWQDFAMRGTEAGRIAELTTIFQRNPAAEMGHTTGDLMVPDENLRAIKAFLGLPTRVDFVNYADLRRAGIGPDIIRPLFEDCRIPAWIFPHAPARFEGQMYDVDLFDDDVRRLFASHYSLTSFGVNFETWSCVASAHPVADAPTAEPRTGSSREGSQDPAGTTREDGS